MHKTFAQLRPQSLLEREVYTWLNVLYLGFDDHQQYEEMFCSYAHPFIKELGTKGITELIKLNDLL